MRFFNLCSWLLLMLPIESMLQLKLADAFTPVVPTTALMTKFETTKTTMPTTLRMKKMNDSENDERIDDPSPGKREPGSFGKLAAAAALASALTINPLPSQAAMTGGRLGGNYNSAPPPVIERSAPRAYRSRYSLRSGYYSRPRVTISPSIGFGPYGYSRYSPFYPGVPVVPYTPFGVSPYVPYGGYSFGRPGIGIRFFF